MDKGHAGSFLEDLQLGQRFSSPPHLLTHADRSQWIALVGDHSPRACGPEGFVSPAQLVCLALGQSVQPVGVNALSETRVGDLLVHRAVGVGTVVSSLSQVIGLEEHPDGERGRAWLRSTSHDAEGQVLLTCVQRVVLPKRAAADTPWADNPVRPNLRGGRRPSELDPAQLPSASRTHGRWWFDDYVVGERVYHRGGHTVHKADHSQLTRSMHNPAWRHFDTERTRGRPLVWSGFSFAVGYAQALNGFENRLGLLAINQLVARAPVKARDTLYAVSDVHELQPLNEAVGAVRSKLTVVRNADPSASRFQTQPEELSEDIVLEVDLWELVAREPDGRG